MIKKSVVMLTNLPVYGLPDMCEMLFAAVSQHGQVIVWQDRRDMRDSPDSPMARYCKLVQSMQEKVLISC